MNQPIESGARHFIRRRRYNLLSFQTRYAVAFIFLSAFVTGLVGLLTFAVFSGVGMGDGSGEGNLKWFVAGLVVLVLGSSALFYMLVIVASHRIAGPLSLMAKYMQEIESGGRPQIRDLRKGDELKEFFAGFRRMMDAILKRDDEEMMTLQKVLENLPQSCDGETKATIANLISNKSLRTRSNLKPPAN